MALKLKIGKKYWIASIETYGTLAKIRPDGYGRDIYDFELEDGDRFMARKEEIAKSQLTKNEE